MAALRRARRAAILGLALTFSPLAACGDDEVPPLPDEFRGLEQREAGCIACHDGRAAAVLPPEVIATPSGHPSMGAMRILNGLTARDRERLGL